MNVIPCPFHFSKRRLRWIPAGAAAAALIAGLPPVRGEAPEVFAIRGARIYPVSSPPIETGTIVLRDGLIEAVGADVAVPPDARVFEGKGLVVTPGWIDAASDIGLPTPPMGAAPARPADAPPERPNLQPQLLVSDSLAVTNAKIEAARQAGFTSVLAVPRRGLLAGQSALINLNGSRETTVVRAPVALHAGPSAGGGFPNSLMGQVAFYRQTFLDARRYGEAWELYRRSPEGLRRPETDGALEALQPVLRGDLPLVMGAESPTDMNRVLRLTDDAGVRAMLIGGARMQEAAPVLAARKIPVLLTVKFVNRPQITDVEDEALRVIRERVEAPKAAGVLQRQGVKFAFASDGLGSADFVKNVRRTVTAGLPADTALRALTLSAAEILGAERQMGSLEKGKIANLTVTNGEPFAEKTQVQYVFVDGRRFMPGDSMMPAANPRQAEEDEDHR